MFFFAKEGIYWSLIKFIKDSFLLNGCGQTYIITKDKHPLSGIAEWF